MSVLKELIKSEDTVKRFEKEYFHNIGKKKKPFQFGCIIREKNNDKKKNRKIYL